MMPWQRLLKTARGGKPDVTNRGGPLRCYPCKSVSGGFRLRQQSCSGCGISRVQTRIGLSKGKTGSPKLVPDVQAARLSRRDITRSVMAWISFSSC